MTGQGAALVVGGSGGLGGAICRELALDWPAVLVGYRAKSEAAAAIARDLAPPCEGVPTAIDLRRPETIEAALRIAVDRFGRVGTVVCAGGVAIAQPFVSQITDAAWREVIETELLGFANLVRGALPCFRAQGGGSFVTVTSFANVHFPPGDALSSVPKAGIESLSRAVAKEEGRYGIRANCVAPGIINAGLGATFQQALYDEKVWAGQRARVPLRRFGEGREVAAAVAFLASGRAAYITGQTVLVDGGLSL